MAVDNYHLLAFFFRVLNIPFTITGYSSILTLISVLTSIWTCTKMFEDSVRTNSYIRNEEFDFIVVGGGSAGAVISNRLSESGQFSVLLLEAGGIPTIFNTIPALAPFNLHQSTDWNYRTVPQDNSCLGVDERKMHWPRGKMLGGSSELNFMIYIRGNPRDYHEWAKISGDDGWSYENVLQYFKKSEDYHGNFPDPDFHGSKGPLHVSSQSYQPCLEYWLAAGEELGYDTETDPNSYQRPGFHPLDVTIWNGKRDGTFEAFIKPYESRSNLIIRKYAHVIKIEVDENNIATGVKYVKDGKILYATARNDIIISAGAIGTPQLLMLSGIGPEAHLREHGITPIVDSPGVGQNLQDHVLTMAGPFLLNTSVSFVTERNLTLDTILQYELGRSGPMSSNIVSGLAFISSSKADYDWPDLQLHMTALGVRHGCSEDLSIAFGTKPNFLMEYLSPYTYSDANFVLLDLGRPKSHGTIELRSKDPFTYPNIDPKYFSHPDDIEAMVDGMRMIVKIFEETQAYQSIGAKLAMKKLPGCEHHESYSDAYYECYVRHWTMTIYHPCCTARFGNDSDPMAVLDSKLRVKGIQRLWVADASVFPKIPNGNLNAPTIMIGEKVSDHILKMYID